MPRSNSRSGRNSNRSGRQHSDWGVMEMARERPFAAAAAAAGAAAAGLFLWSKRTRISDQLSSLGDQVGQWTENLRSNGDASDFEPADLSSGPSPGTRRSSKAQRKANVGQSAEIEETPTS